MEELLDEPTLRLDTVLLDIGKYTGEVNTDDRPHGKGALRYVFVYFSRLRLLYNELCNVILNNDNRTF